MTSSIIAPLCVYTFGLFVVWGMLGFVRIRGGLRGEIPNEYFRVGTGPRPSDRIVDIHHHFSTQFEIPILFYLGCLASLVAEAADSLTIQLAWSFVVIRFVHTIIVLVRNDPRIRVAPYVLSSFIVWAIWADLFRRVVWPSL